MDNAAKGADEEDQKEGQKKKDKAKWELKTVKKYVY